MPRCSSSCRRRVAAPSLPVRPTSSTRPPRARDVVRHVGGAAHAVLVALVGDHRHRSLGRDAAHAPHHELVEHHVADDEHGRRTEAVRSASAGVRGSRALGLRQPMAGVFVRVSGDPPLVDGRGLRAADGAAAHGSVSSTRSSSRNSESPKLYSKNPAASIAPVEAQRRGSQVPGRSLRPAARAARGSPHDEPEPDAERRQAALRGDLHRHVVQVRRCLLDRRSASGTAGRPAGRRSGRRRLAGPRR